MTEIEAIKESLDLWEWLCENFPKEKAQYPYFYKLLKMIGSCPCCYYYRENKINNTIGCSKCPIVYCNYASSYYVWNNFTQKRFFGNSFDQAQAAYRAANHIRSLLTHKYNLLQCTFTFKMNNF